MKQLRFINANRFSDPLFYLYIDEKNDHGSYGIHIHMSQYQARFDPGSMKMKYLALYKPPDVSIYAYVLTTLNIDNSFYPTQVHYNHRFFKVYFIGYYLARTRNYLREQKFFRTYRQ